MGSRAVGRNHALRFPVPSSPEPLGPIIAIGAARRKNAQTGGWPRCREPRVCAPGHRNEDEAHLEGGGRIVDGVGASGNAAAGRKLRGGRREAATP